MKGSPRKVTLVTAVALVTVAVCASDKRRWPATSGAGPRSLRGASQCEPRYGSAFSASLHTLMDGSLQTFAAIEPHFRNRPAD
ncbi:hypothetical protein PF005_g6667 [Phytophthora fragariae]|uniref:RxLR effector protein n=1 Tax=Phytophthora fragariae TaxID=53985 RepID=A0A6A3UD80_9STRA|nr:hypothetical protein PF003_g127 [Phytophthora fragariae]KAE8947023.1 hypothetical protein PF009_g3367 [Phytophthora fragariae]KAE9022617.1 hypothetical protein PF011_g4367 [Phytophthora fragariae]KAE9124454.1 hypothetical protein PF010_g6007 [Phytophthora fragariae]KAE9127987.1 hypothetical protein PF007_g5413 [Phytophthora fragariae]